MKMSKSFPNTGSTSRVSRPRWCWSDLEVEAFDLLSEQLLTNNSVTKTIRCPNTQGVLKSAPALEGLFDPNSDRVLVRFVPNPGSVRLPRTKHKRVHKFRPVKHQEGLEFSRISGTARDPNYKIYAYRHVSDKNLLLYIAQGQIPVEYVDHKGRWQGTSKDSTDGSMGQNHLDKEFIDEIFSLSHSNPESASPSTSEFNESSEDDGSKIETVSKAKDHSFDDQSVYTDFDKFLESNEGHSSETETIVPMANDSPFNHVDWENEEFVTNIFQSFDDAELE